MTNQIDADMDYAQRVLEGKCVECKQMLQEWAFTVSEYDMNILDYKNEILALSEQRGICRKCGLKMVAERLRKLIAKKNQTIISYTLQDCTCISPRTMCKVSIGGQLTDDALGYILDT